MRRWPFPQTPLRNSLLALSPNLAILVSIDEPFDVEIRVGWLEDVARAGLAAARVDANGEVSLLITGDETVRALNSEYRGLDENTDVLSFSAEHAGHWEGDDDGPEQDFDEITFVLPSDAAQPLGEIIVSWPQALRQAEEHAVSPMRELAHLVVHGALHLVGYDHLEPEEEALMQAREREALDSLQLTEPLLP